MHRESKTSVFSRSLYSDRLSSSSSQTYSNGGSYYSDYDDYVDESETDDEFSDLESLFVKEECDVVGGVITSDAYCFDLVKFSEKFVDATIVAAKKRLLHKPNVITVKDIVSPILSNIVNDVVQRDWESHIFEQSKTKASSQSYYSRSTVSYNLPTDNVEWPKNSEFNIKLGLEKLADYVGTWESIRDWQFCVEFLGFESEDCSNVFIYEVEWSKPTQAYPIPQTTASVYFALEVFKMVPYNFDRSIDVTYVFECSNVIHAPGRIDFQEKWLQDIIDAKVKFFKTVTFGSGKETGRDCEDKERVFHLPGKIFQQAFLINKKLGLLTYDSSKKRKPAASTKMRTLHGPGKP